MPIANMETNAAEWNRLFHKQARSRNFMDYVEYDRFQSECGVSMETVRVDSEELDPENGQGFETRITFQDGSHLVSKEVYLTDKNGNIAFEKRQ